MGDSQVIWMKFDSVMVGIRLVGLNIHQVGIRLLGQNILYILKMVLIFFNLIWSLYENILLNGIYGTSANIFWDFAPLAKIISIN